MRDGKVTVALVDGVREEVGGQAMDRANWAEKLS